MEARPDPDVHPLGFVYTQLCDVEQELNGLLTYDRCPKAAPERIAEINLRGNATRSAGK